jgi:hypothetical protein
MSNKHLILFSMCTIVALIFTNRLHAQFADMAKWVPDGANAIVMVRAKDIFDSPISKKEHWRTDRLKRFKSGAALLPPSTNRLLIAAQLDFEFMEPIWQSTVFENSKSEIDITEVSKKIKGNLEDISGKQAISLPNDAYLVKVDDMTLVSMSPANRQLTARWLRSRESAAMQLSPYLKQAVQFADRNSHIIIAFDFEDVVHPDQVKRKLEESGIVDEGDMKTAPQTISTIKGLTLGINVNEQVTGSIKVDFNDNPGVLAQSGKHILLYALKQNGFMIDDFENWPMEIQGNQLRMTGPLTAMGLRQIGSFIEHPLATVLNQANSEGFEVDMKTRSLQYFRSVEHLMEELRGKNAKGLDTYANWFDRYARQIDNLSVLNVDPAVIDHGRYVAANFREISGMLLGVNYDKVVSRQQYSDTNAAPATEYSTTSYETYGGYRNGWAGYRRSYSEYNKNTRRRQQVTGQARLYGEQAAKEIIREVDAETAKIRGEMTEKYQTDF